MITARVWLGDGVKAKKEVQRRDVSVQFNGASYEEQGFVNCKRKTSSMSDCRTWNGRFCIQNSIVELESTESEKKEEQQDEIGGNCRKSNE